MPINNRRPKIGKANFTGEFIVDYMKGREGYVAEVYKDKFGYETVGYGHLLTKADKASGRFTGKTLTEADADALLREDIKAHQDPWLKQLKVPISENQKSALTLFAFNVGAGAAQRIVKLINQGNTQAAADKFLQYNKGRVDGALVVDKHLTELREKERELFLSVDSTQANYEKYVAKYTRGRKKSNGEPSTGIAQTGPSELPSPIGLQPQSDAEIYAAMCELTSKLRGAGPLLSEIEYFNRLKVEGSGV